MAELHRSYTWHDPSEVLAAASGLSPLAYLRAVVAGELPQPPIAETLGYRLVQADPGVAVFEGEPAAWHYNPIGTVHAGFAVTLLDSAMGCALVAALDEPAAWTTLELKSNFTRAITSDTGTVRATGTILHRGRRIVTTEARLEDSAGRLLAHATSTILILGAEAGGLVHPSPRRDDTT